MPIEAYISSQVQFRSCTLLSFHFYVIAQNWKNCLQCHPKLARDSNLEGSFIRDAVECNCPPLVIWMCLWWKKLLLFSLWSVGNSVTKSFPILNLNVVLCETIALAWACTYDKNMTTLKNIHSVKLKAMFSLKNIFNIFKLVELCQFFVYFPSST